MYYAVAEIAMMVFAYQSQLISDASTDWAITASAPSSLSISPIVYDEYDLPTAPTYTSPIPPENFTKVDAFLDDDDVEMSSVAIQKYQAEVQRYSQEVQESVQKFTTATTEYNAIIAKRAASSEGHMAAEINSIQNEVSDYQQRVTEFGQRLQENIQEENAKITRRNTTMQSALAIRADYLARFEEYVQSKAPASSGAKKGEEA
tara:strand:- start:88 stop:699 length:612 start_codon:yes stop_codon:yes gene_type:complete